MQRSHKQEQVVGMETRQRVFDSSGGAVAQQAVGQPQPAVQRRVYIKTTGTVQAARQVMHFLLDFWQGTVCSRCDQHGMGVAGKLMPTLGGCY